MNLKIILEKMKKEDTSKVVNLITKTMDKENGEWAKKIFKNHDFSSEDKRIHYVAKLEKEIIGTSGLYLEESVDDVASVSFLAVNSNYQRQGIGTFMMDNLINLSKQKKLRKLFIVTYKTPNFKKARNFYEKYGFTNHGFIKDYFAQGKDMLIYGIDI